MTVVAPVVAPDEGGMERVMSHVVTGLLEREFSVRVIALSCRLAAHPRLRWFRVRGVRRPAALSFPWFAVAAGAQLRRFRRGLVVTQGAILPQAADVVAAHFCAHAFVAGSHAPRRRHDSMLYRINEALDRRMTVAAESWVYRRERVGRVVAVSPGLAAELRRYFPALDGCISVVPNGVDLDEFRPDPQTRALVRSELDLGTGPVAAFVGGDWGRKGLDMALEAVAATPPWALLVVGDGDIDRYAARAAQLGVAARVRFVGRQPRPARFLAAADAFVFPSSYEPFGLVVLEAGAAGVPLVVTRTEGAVELVRDGENGRFVRRDPGAISAVLSELAADERLRAAMGARARELAVPYAWSRVVDAYAAVLDEIGSTT